MDGDDGGFGQEFLISIRDSRIEWLVSFLEFGQADVVHAGFSVGVRNIEIMANAELAGRVLILRQCHVQGAGPNGLGIAALRQLANWAKAYLDVDELRIEGAVRTSGAGPGRRPAPTMFR
jgi:hypothetical protein